MVLNPIVAIVSAETALGPPDSRPDGLPEPGYGNTTAAEIVAGKPRALIAVDLAKIDSPDGPG